MHLMVRQFGDTDTRFDVDDVLAALNVVSGSDFSEFFDRYIYGAEEMPDIAASLFKAGLIVDQYGDEFYVRRAENPTPEQAAIYNAIFVQEW